MAHVLKLIRGPVRLRLGAVIAVFGLFAAVPAASQAIVAATPPGIAGAGTVTGTWTSGAFDGQSQVVQVASVLTCTSISPPQTSFVGVWTDPAGASHTFKYMALNFLGCNYDHGFSNPPFQAELRGSGTTSGFTPGDSTIDETLESPDGSPPNTMRFTLTTPEGTITVDPQFPGRIQAFGGAPSAT
jgi:hypothetical protein